MTAGEWGVRGGGKGGDTLGTGITMYIQVIRLGEMKCQNANNYQASRT